MSRENKLQSSGFDKMMHLYQRLMQIIAILPLDSNDYTSLVSRVQLIFFLIMSIANWNSVIFHIILIQGAPSIDTVCETSVCLAYNTRYYILLWHRKKIANLLEDCRSIWNDLCDDEHGIRVVHDFERKVRLLFKCFIGSCMSAMLLYTLTAINLTLTAARNSNDSNYYKYMPFKWFGMGGQRFWLGYEFNFVMSFITGFNACFVLTTVDTIGPLFIMIGAGYFRALRLRLYRTYNLAMDEGNNRDADQELIDCSRLHQRIISYCSKIDRITRTLFTIQLLGTVYNTSLIGLKLVGKDPDKYKYLSLAFINVGQLFICQWAPDHLVQESTAISTAIYSVSLPWMKRRVGKMLVLMIARAQRPVQMTAAGFIHLSIAYFGEMLKSAATFFAVLRRLSL